MYSGAIPSAQIMKILWRQQQELLKKSPDCVIPIINNEDPLDIQADIIGPKDTPYEEGIFRVKLFIPSDFPQAAPKGFFMTKIYHPNVSEKGEICVNSLKKDWNPRKWSLYNLFEVIKCLLIVPFPESSLNEEAGKLFMENYDEYFKIAKIYTSVHAMKKSQNNQSTINNDNANSRNDLMEVDEVDNANTCNSNTSNDTSNFVIFNLNNNAFNMNSNYANSSNTNSFNLFREQNNNNSVFGQLSNCNKNLYSDNTQINRAKTFLNKETNFGFYSKNSSEIAFTNNLNLNNLQGNNGNIENNEKPKLGFLPFMRAPSVSISSNNLNNCLIRQVNSFNLSHPQISRRNSNKDEINKWLMRI